MKWLSPTVFIIKDKKVILRRLCAINTLGAQFGSLCTFVLNVDPRT